MFLNVEFYFSLFRKNNHKSLPRRKTRGERDQQRKRSMNNVSVLNTPSSTPISPAHHSQVTPSHQIHEQQTGFPDGQTGSNQFQTSLHALPTEETNSLLFGSQRPNSIGFHNPLSGEFASSRPDFEDKDEGLETGLLLSTRAVKQAVREVAERGRLNRQRQEGNPEEESISEII